MYSDVALRDSDTKAQIGIRSALLYCNGSPARTLRPSGEKYTEVLADI